MPAADLSQQISLAGTEASGTGNMKLALNGALTIGTADGANIEMADAVGRDNMFIFGLTIDEVRDVKAKGYVSADIVAADPRLQEVMQQLSGDEFSPGEPGRHQPIVDALVRDGDRYLALRTSMPTWRRRMRWTGSGPTRTPGPTASCATSPEWAASPSDRAIREYADRIWRIPAR